MNKTQMIGIGFIFTGIACYNLVGGDITATLSGVLCAIGLACILKLIDFKSQKSDK